MTPPEGPGTPQPDEQLGREVLTSSAGQLFAIAVGATGGVLASRILGPEDKGVYAIAIVAGTVVGQLASAGLDFWVQRWIPSGGDPEVASRVTTRHLRVAAPLLFMGAAVAAMLGHPVVAAVFVYGVVWAWQMIRLGGLLARGRIRQHAIAVGIGSLSYLLMVTVLLIMGDTRDSVLVLLAAAVALFLCGAVTHIAPDPPRPTKNGLELVVSSVYRFGALTALGEVLTVALLRAGLVAISLIGSVRDAGLYSVALASVEILAVIPAGIAQVLLPHVVRTGAQARTAEVTRLAVLVGIGVGGFVVVAAPFLLPLLFGSDFAGASVAVAPLAGAAILLGVWRILIADLIARGDTRTRTQSAVFGVVIIVAAQVALVPAFGLVGAGVASLLGYAAVTLFATWRWTNSSGNKATDLVPGRGEFEMVFAKLRQTVHFRERYFTVKQGRNSTDRARKGMRS